MVGVVFVPSRLYVTIVLPLPSAMKIFPFEGYFSPRPIPVGSRRPVIVGDLCDPLDRYVVTVFDPAFVTKMPPRSSTATPTGWSIPCVIVGNDCVPSVA